MGMTSGVFISHISGATLVESKLLLVTGAASVSLLDASIFFRYQVSLFNSVTRHIHHTSLGHLSIVILLILLFFGFSRRLQFVAASEHQACWSSFALAVRLTWTAETFAGGISGASVSALVEVHFLVPREVATLV